MTVRSLVFAGACAAVSVVAGCAAPVGPGSEGTTGRESEAILSCGFDYLLETEDGPNGPVNYCQQIAPTGTDPEYCYGAYSIPTALVGQDCTKGTHFGVRDIGYGAGYVCPTGIPVPSRLGVVSSTLPTCDKVNGVPQPTAGGCLAVMTFSQVTTSCVANAPAGWQYVVEVELITGGPIGGACSGSCATVGGDGTWH